MKRNWHMALLYGIVAAMQVCWLGTALDLANQKAADGFLSILVVLGFYPLAFGFHRLLQVLPWSRVVLPSCIAWAVAMLLLAKIQFFNSVPLGDPLWLRNLWQAMAQMFHTFNPEGLMVVSSAILWGLGWRLAYGRIHFATLITEFQFGLAIFLIVFFVHAQGDWKSSALVPAALIFFSLALLGMSVSHAREQNSWLSGPYKGLWFGFLLFSIALILTLGLLISVAVNPSLLDFILSLLAKAGQFILEMIQKFFTFLNSFFPPPKPAGLPPSLRMPQISRPPEEIFWVFSDSVREVIRFIWGMGCLTLILVALWRIAGQVFNWLRRKLSGLEGAEVEPLPGAFREDFWHLLRKIFLALRIKWPFRGGRKSPPLLSEIESVRRIYRQLLKWAAAKGCGRHISQTPLEYLQTLLQWLPEGRWDFTFITHQYVRARYSLLVPTEKELEQVGRSWQQLKQMRSKPAAKRTFKNRR
jgi:hypothetical protein